jgi:hypothetical protein
MKSSIFMLSSLAYYQFPGLNHGWR